MTVFDNGRFSERALQDRLSSPRFARASQNIASKLNNDWKEGFQDGYQAALDRYIPEYKDK